MVVEREPRRHLGRGDDEGRPLLQRAFVLLHPVLHVGVLGLPLKWCGTFYLAILNFFCCQHQAAVASGLVGLQMLLFYVVVFDNSMLLLHKRVGVVILICFQFYEFHYFRSY